MKEPPKYNFWYFDISIVGGWVAVQPAACAGEEQQLKEFWAPRLHNVLAPGCKTNHLCSVSD